MQILPNNTSGRGSALELKDYLRILRRSWILIAASASLGIATAGAASFFVAPTYTSEIKLFVALQNSQSVSELQQGSVFAQARIQSYVETVKTPLVLQPVVDSLGLETSSERLSESILASSDINTVLIGIRVNHESPVQAAAIAQAVGSSLVKTVDELERPSAGDTSPVRLSIVTPAKTPTSPSAPNVGMNLMLGFAVGLGLGFGAAVLRTLTDTRLRGNADLRRVTDAPLLGAIAFDGEAAKKPLLTQTAPQSLRAEAFRQLRTNMQFAQVSHGSKAVLITSSVPGEGKSTTAINLAIALSQAGRSVALVDADLRRPMIAEYLGIERRAGLTTVLVGQAEVGDMLQRWGDEQLFVLAAGRIPPNPSELLGSKEMTTIIKSLEDTFDAVIIDSPPLLPVTDAAVLAQQVGGVVVVAGAQKLRTTDLQKALTSLAMVSGDLLGVVLNRIPSTASDAYSYGYNSYVGDLVTPEVDSVQVPLSRKAQREASPDVIDTVMEHQSIDRVPVVIRDRNAR